MPRRAPPWGRSSGLRLASLPESETARCWNVFRAFVAAAREFDRDRFLCPLAPVRNHFTALIRRWRGTASFACGLNLQRNAIPLAGSRSYERTDLSRRPDRGDHGRAFAAWPALTDARKERHMTMAEPEVLGVGVV